MLPILFARDYSGEAKVLEIGQGAYDKFKDLVNAGKENADLSEISLHEINLSDGRKTARFMKPLNDEQKRANAERDDRTNKARLLEEARQIQRNNDAAQRQIDAAKKQLKPLSPEHKAVLAEQKPVSAPKLVRPASDSPKQKQEPKTS